MWPRDGQEGARAAAGHPPAAVEWERLGANPARAVRKPPLKRGRVVVPLPPQTVEALRAHLLNAGRLRDATLVSVLA